MGTPNMGVNLWGASPLYENGTQQGGSIPTVTPIEQVRDEGNCGEATNHTLCDAQQVAGAIGTSFAQTTLVRSRSASRNRLMLSRMSGGVGRGSAMVALTRFGSTVYAVPSSSAQQPRERRSTDATPTAPDSWALPSSLVLRLLPKQPVAHRSFLPTQIP